HATSGPSTRLSRPRRPRGGKSVRRGERQGRPPGGGARRRARAQQARGEGPPARGADHMTAEFDRGPPKALAEICARCPPPSNPKAFWTAWGPVFYRGRLDGSARVLCIASDPGPTERIADRTLVGDAGQRVQGFVAKLGLTRSYLCVNAFPYALHPSWGPSADELLAEPTQTTWRTTFYDAVR